MMPLRTRRIVAIKSNINLEETRTELDTHADTCAVGAHALILRDHGKNIEVTGYDAKDGGRFFQTVSAAVAYDDPKLGRPIILVINQCIHIPTIKHNLLCPMQLRVNDIKVNDVPKFLSDEPTDQTHAIVIPVQDQDDVVIPLSIEGVTSYFPTRRPTPLEYETIKERYELTYDSPDWEQHSKIFLEQEEQMTNSRGELNDGPARRPTQLCSLLEATQNISCISSQQLPTNRNKSWIINELASKRSPGIDPTNLSKRWGIGLDSAKHPILGTTQWGTRSVLLPSLSRLPPIGRSVAVLPPTGHSGALSLRTRS